MFALLALIGRVPAAADPVTIPSGDVALTSELLTPAGAGPFPLVLALHGCGGLYTKRNAQLTARDRDWSDRFVAAGFAVLLLDSFTGRGVRQICTGEHPPVTPKLRADDVRNALIWLAQRPEVDAKRIALVGWSHGAMTLLWAVRPSHLDGTIKPAVALAFYPGCREIQRQPDWKPTVPLTILIGAADDWTQAAPCRELAAKTGFKYIEYSDAFHGFDAPSTALHVRQGLRSVRGGEAHVGTNPQARTAAITEVMDTLLSLKAGVR